MPGKPRVLVALVAAAAAVTSIAFVNAVPAYAKDVVSCNSDRSGDGTPENQKTIFATNGAYVTITIDLCVSRIDKNSQRGGTARSITWKGSIAAKRFNSFKLTVRLEHSEKTVKTHTCDMTATLDRYRMNYRAYSCLAGWATNAGAGHWTTDATVVYDVYNDGKGAYTWQLRGSPEIN